jgi:hypothetical protein
MIRFHSWVLLNTLGLMIAFGLTGCGSSKSGGSVTPVSNTTTVVAPNGTNMAKPPTGHGAPQMGMTMAPGAPGAMPGMMGGHGAPVAGSSNSSSSSAMMDPAAMMKAHGAATPPGSAPGAPGMTDPSAMAKAHGAGMPPGGSSSSAAMDPAAMMKAHGAAAPPGGAVGSLAPGSAGTQGSALDPAGIRNSGGAGSAPGMQGGPGGPGGAGGPQGSKFAAGSVEDTIYQFCVAMADGDTAAAAEYLNPKAKGMVGQLRDGDLSEDKVDEIKSAVSPVTELMPNPNQTATKRSLRNKKNQIIAFVLKKDKDDDDKYKIVDISVSKPKTR